jgi:RNA polymerase sigma-70 factor (ECF subfamily)
MVSTVLHPVEGGEQIAHAWVVFTDQAPGVTLLECTVNGQPGLVAQKDGVTVTAYAFEIAGERIKRMWGIRNPDELPALDHALTCRAS